MRPKKLQALMADPAVGFSALGEVHLQQHGSRRRIWAPPEVRDPGSLRDPTLKQGGYFETVLLSDGRFYSLGAPGYLNATTW